MKIRNIFRFAAALALPVALLGSCTGDFEDLNTNPFEVDPSTLPFEAQMIEAISYASTPPQQNMFQFWGNLTFDTWSGYFMSPNGNFTNTVYNLIRGHCGGMHENFTLHVLTSTSRLIPVCVARDRGDYAGILRIVQSYAALNATDTYGPIAFMSKINNPEGPTFAYSKQEEIYNYIFEDLDKAIEELKNGKSAIEDLQIFDYWCNGDRDKWIRIANTLKLRMALRMVKAKPAEAKTIAEEAVRGGVLEDEDVLINKGLENNMDLMFDWGDCGANAMVITLLEGMKDPRLPLFFTKNMDKIGTHDKGTFYFGTRSGAKTGPKPNDYMKGSNWVGERSLPQPVMKAGESYFLRAEGALRGWNMGGKTAKQFYEEGIRIAMKHEVAYRGGAALEAGVSAEDAAITDAEIDAYLAGTTAQSDYVDPINAENNIKATCKLPVQWKDTYTDEEKLELIVTQRYLAYFPLSIEAWSDFRRTGYPRLFPNTHNDSNGTIDTEEQIRRSIYSDNQYSANEVELLKGIELLNAENSSTKFKGDIGGTRVWWDRADKGNF